MNVLSCSVEMSPFAKVGGLADVAGALPKALRHLGHDARAVMPLYRMIEEDPRWELKTVIESIDVPIGPNWSKHAWVKEAVVDGLPVWFIGTDEWFTEAVSSDTLYQPGGDMHLFFTAAIFRICEVLQWIPDVLHAHDWHTGFIPVWLREKAGMKWQKTGCLFTIHNQAYQGEFGYDVLERLGLPGHLYHYEKLESWGHVNFLKAGSVFSDRVNTVSKTYAKEILTPEYGCALEGLMTHIDRAGRLSGIVNGIDIDVFDPATDPDLPAHFSAADISGKAICRAELLKELGLPELPGTPVVGMVSRLSSQKGMDLVIDIADKLVDLPIQLVVLGLGDPALARGFKQLSERHPTKARYIDRFDAPLGQRIYAGCDAFLMPSNFEPCGLGQLIAMRYGTVPVVRATGGLADTVFDNVNGFAYKEKGTYGIQAALERMVLAFQHPETWQRIQAEGINADFSWDHSAPEYVKLYEQCVHVRKSMVA